MLTANGGSTSSTSRSSGAREREHALAAPPRERERAASTLRKGTSAPSRAAIASSAGSPIGCGVDGVERAQHRARVGAAAAESSTDGDALRQLDREAGGPARRVAYAVGGAPREVPLGGAELSRIDVAVDVERARAVGGAYEHVVGEREPEEQRLELMIARRLAREDAQAEVDLGLRGDACRARARHRARAHESGRDRRRGPPLDGRLGDRRAARR